MKRIKIAILTISSMLIFSGLNAQNEMDALRYSNIGFGGTARYVGAGGAFGALGADFSTLSSNPAGIGLYKKSEITFTPSIFHSSTTSTFGGKVMDDYKNNFNFSNLGLVLSYETDDDNWKNIQIGIGYNRLANFNNRLFIEGDNKESSLMDAYIVQANGTQPNSLNSYDTYLAWQTYLLDTFNGLNYTSMVPMGGIMQRKEVTTYGGINELAMSFGGNFQDVLYIGGTIGLPTIRYIEEAIYSELDNGDSIIDFKKFTLSDDLETHGTGVNFKFGIIARVNDYFRIGGAIHSPTYFAMNDSYSREMKNYLDNGQTYKEVAPEGTFDYKLNTPFRAIGSASFIIGKLGFVSADYEYVDYSEARLRNFGGNSNEGASFADVNSTIRQTYQATQIIRGGAELSFGILRVRGGAAYYGSPYKNKINDGEKMVYTAGIGLKEDNYFLDFGYALSKMSEDYYLYPGNGTKVVNDVTSNCFLVTLGFRY